MLFSKTMFIKIFEFVSVFFSIEEYRAFFVCRGWFWRLRRFWGKTESLGLFRRSDNFSSEYNSFCVLAGLTRFTYFTRY